MNYRSSTRQVTALVPAVLALAALAVQWGTPPVVRIPTGLALALVLPGLALTETLFGHRALSAVERLVLPVALSAAVLILGGLALYAAGADLNRTVWAILTTAVTVVAGGVGWLRRRQVGAGSPTETATFGKVLAAEREMITRRDFAWRLAPLVLAVGLLAAASVLALTSAARDRTPFTALSVAAESAAGSPTTRPLALSVRSEEQRAATYTLRARSDDGARWTFPIALEPGGTWTTTIRVPAKSTVTAELFRGTDDQPYRTVRWSPSLT